MRYGVTLDRITVTFDGSDSFDADGEIVKYEWDFDYVEGQFEGQFFDAMYTETAGSHPDGKFDGITKYTYNSTGNYKIKLRVTDNGGYPSYSSTITVDIKDKIQDAIDAAVNGNIIVVAPGLYTGDGNRDLDFSRGLSGGQTRAITVKSTAPDNPDVVAATVIDCQGSQSNNHRGFNFHSSEGSNSVLVGFTIKNGYHNYGAGIYCVNNSSPTITDCRVIRNTSSINGAGIYCVGGSPDITGCIIYDNNAVGGNGGGIYCENSSPIISSCKIMHNRATAGDGGGVYCTASSPTISDCIIAGNWAGSSSTSTGYGGGIYCDGCTQATQITNCVIRDNRGRAGGGVCNDSSSPDVIGCIFASNRVTDYGGGMYNLNISNPKIANCVFIGNDAEEYGGGMENERSSPQVINCTFNENSTEGYGGGMDNWGDVVPANPIITNCIFWGNHADDSGNEIYNSELYAEPVVTYSCVQGGWEGSTNTDDDPKFVKDAAGYGYGPEGPDDVFGTWDDGLALSFGSPCIDKGSDGAVPAGIDKDITGRKRIADGDHQITIPDTDPPTVDMGAYELGKIWFVKKDAPPGPGYNNGKSWGTAFTDLQNALQTVAQTGLVDGNEIWVAAVDGNPYKPLTPSNRTATFTLVSGTGLYGGFKNGVEVCRIQRDWVANETVLSGEIGGTGIGDNCYHVVTDAYNTVLDGFTITAGNANVYYLYGYGYDYGYGGGIFITYSPTIANCKVKENYARCGGGMSNRTAHGDPPSPTLINCTFEKNKAIYSNYNSGSGGGIYNRRAHPKLINCVFQLNTADKYGGGIYNGLGIYSLPSYPTLVGCTFSGNQASYSGGGIYNYVNCCPTLINCVFSNNSALNNNGGGIYNYQSGSQTLTNCTFYGNSASIGLGGGVYSYSSDLAIINDLTIINCILWGNTASNGSQIALYLSTLDVAYSDVEYGQNGIYKDVPSSINWGLGNITSPPLFVKTSDPDGDDNKFGTGDDGLRLGFGSLCIDAGDTDVISTKTDVSRRARRMNDQRTFDTGNGTPPIVDMGAYEYIASPTIVGGEWHTLRNKIDETLQACGNNYYYQLGTGDNTERLTLVSVSAGEMWPSSGIHLEGIVFVDAGYSHSLALDKSSHLWAWGANFEGQVGDGRGPGNVRHTAAEVVDGHMATSSGRLEDIVKVAAGRSGQISLALDRQGRLWAWGLNDKGQLGIGDSISNKRIPVQVVGEAGKGSALPIIIDFDAGVSHAIALDDLNLEGVNGNVWCWGWNSRGQLGNGQSGNESNKPIKVLNLSGIVDVAVCCGWDGGQSETGSFGSSYAVDSLNQVWAWGSGRSGKLGQGNENDSTTPVLVKGEGGQGILQNIVAISAGNEHVLALDSTRKVWAWGKNEFGQLGCGGSSNRSTPVLVKKDVAGHPSLTNIVYIDAGFEHSMAIDDQGTIWVWGHNTSGELGQGVTYFSQEYAKPM
jgi:alpha-tubulin suppressor-like RCC1 family protein